MIARIYSAGSDFGLILHGLSFVFFLRFCILCFEQALIKQYSKGERSIEETAALVGLRVPERKLP